MVLWGAFPVLTVGVYSQLPPFLTLSLSSIFAAVSLAVVMAYKKLWFELSKKEAIKNALLMTLINGVGYYCLFFVALKYTSPGNAALISLVENFTNFIFFHIYLKEDYSFKEVAGYSLTIVGAFVILFSGFSEAKIGDLLIVAASIIAPFGNYFMRKARSQISSISLMFFRTFVAGLIVFLISVLFKENLSILQSLSFKNWLFLLFNGVLVLAFSKVLWTEGIHRIPVSKALALTNISPIFTIVFVLILFNQVPSTRQLWSVPFLVFGIYILLRQKKNTDK